MKQFKGDNVYKLPVDQHELMAMIAPRALLETGNSGQYWLSNGSNYVTARATQQIYNALGIGDRFGFYIDGNHAHCATLPAEAPAISSFVKKFMLGQTISTDVEVYPNPADTVNYGYPIVVAGGNYAYFFPTMNYQRWTNWWGTDNPVFPDNWDTGGTVFASVNGDLDINSGDVVKGGYQLLLDGAHPAAKVSLVSGAKITTDIACQGGVSYTLTIPLAAQTYSFAAGDTPWNPSSNPHSPLVFQGSTTATPPAGVPECVGGHTVNAYFTTLGVSVGGSGNPGGPGLLTTDVTDPLNLRFHLLDNNNGQSTQYHGPVNVNWSPLTSANGTNHNPVP